MKFVITATIEVEASQEKYDKFTPEELELLWNPFNWQNKNVMIGVLITPHTEITNVKLELVD